MSAQKLDPARDDMAVDRDGNPLPYAPGEVRDIVLKMIDEGDIVAAIVRGKNGDIAVQVFGPPSRELLGVLEDAVKGYRRAIRGH